MRRALVILIVAVAFTATGCNKKTETSSDQTGGQTNQAVSQPSTTDPATAASTPAAEPPAPPPAPEPIVIPAGTVITVKTGQALSSKTNHAGDSFSATVASPVSVDGKIVIPTSSAAHGTVVDAKAKGKVKGEGLLNLALTELTINGHSYPVRTAVLGQTEKGKGKRTAATTGGGAAGGALIGGLAGGGKGAAIGAAVGAGAGFVGGAMTGNKQIEIPAESALSFKLTSSITVKP